MLPSEQQQGLNYRKKDGKFSHEISLKMNFYSLVPFGASVETEHKVIALKPMNGNSCFRKSKIYKAG